MTPLPVDSGAPPAAADLCARAFSLLLEAVEEAVLRGRLRTAEPAYAAQVLWACLHGAVALLITLPRNRSSDVIPGPGLIDDVLDNGLRGLGADRPEA